MANPRPDPYGAYNFLVEVEGFVSAGFTECSGIATETDIVEYRQGNEPLGVRKLPGLTKYTNVTLKRGVTKNKDLWIWRKRIMDGELDRRSVAIILLDQSRQEVVRYQLSQAWPCKWVGPTLKAGASETAIETLELTYEGLEIET